MKLLFSMPGGSEWILIIIILFFLLIMPILAIYYYSKSKRLMKELENLTQEKNTMLAKLLEKTS